MVIRIPKEFAEDCELLIKDRVDNYNWTENDIAEFKVFVRAMWEAGMQKEIIDYVSSQTNPIKERLDAASALYNRIKSIIKEDAITTTLPERRRVRKTRRNAKDS